MFVNTVPKVLLDAGTNPQTGVAIRIETVKAVPVALVAVQGTILCSSINTIRLENVNLLDRR